MFNGGFVSLAEETDRELVVRARVSDDQIHAAVETLGDLLGT